MAVEKNMEVTVKRLFSYAEEHARQATSQAAAEETIRRLRVSRQSRNDKAAIQPLFYFEITNRIFVQNVRTIHLSELLWGFY